MSVLEMFHEMKSTCGCLLIGMRHNHVKIRRLFAAQSLDFNSHELFRIAVLTIGSNFRP